MIQLLTTIYITAVLCITPNAMATETESDTAALVFPMDANTLIEIESYDPETKFFEIKDVVLYGQGPWYTTAAQLAKAVHALKLERINRSPSSIVNNQYTTDEVMLIAAGPGKPPAFAPKPVKKKK